MEQTTQTEMTETKPRKVRGGGAEKVTRVDHILTASVLAIAGLAAALPWYVLFHPEKFGVNVSGWQELLGPKRERNGTSVGIAAARDLDPLDSMPYPDSVFPDDIVTATTPNPASAEGLGDGPPSQPFPGNPSYRLLHVSNGRALIEDESGMFIVQVGSLLPDNSRLTALQHENGKWQLVTSAGTVLTE